MNAPYSRTLFALLCEQAERHPNRIAVISGGDETSYRELAEAAGRVAGGLRVRGIGRGSRLGILIDNRREWLEALFGAVALGAVAVPFSTWSKEAELDFLFADAEIDALVAVDRVGAQDFASAIANLLSQPGRFPRLHTIAMLGGVPQLGWIAYGELLASKPIEGDNAKSGDDCFTLYTSGSSARPKAVRLCHGSTIENGFNIGERMHLSPDDRVLLAPPLFWSYGAANALPATFTHGAALVLQNRFEPGEWIGLVERHSCTAVYTLPSMTGAVLRHPEFRRERVATLRTGLMIGSPEEVRIAAEELGVAEICNIYGATETYGNCCVTPCDWPLARRMASQGPPLPGNTMRIVDPESGASLPAGEAGLVEVTGHVTPGYVGASAEHNAAAFTADGYFCTSDLGFLDEVGDFHFVGRDADVIKRAGINVSPAEVESLLLQHPEVTQVAVVGAPAGERGEVIVAFVVPSTGATLDAEALRVHCRTLASAYKVPDRFEICAALPVTETGKLFRRALKERAAALPATTASACGGGSA
jgi:fatty-acyl-CoA synthase